MGSIVISPGRHFLMQESCTPGEAVPDSDNICRLSQAHNVRVCIGFASFNAAALVLLDH